MGLPGSGKTTFAEALQKELGCAWYNADKIRSQSNDWDFSYEARIRAAARMRNLADFESAQGRIVICDFVCPTPETRILFDADVTIWMDTINAGRFSDTNELFVPPLNPDFRFSEWPTASKIEHVSNHIRNLNMRLE